MTQAQPLESRAPPSGEGALHPHGALSVAESESLGETQRLAQAGAGLRNLLHTLALSLWRQTCLEHRKAGGGVAFVPWMSGGASERMGSARAARLGTGGEVWT